MVLALVSACAEASADRDEDLGGESSETSGGTDETTGGEFTGTSGDVCRLGETGDSDGADGAWLEIHHHGQPVDDGTALALECGPQGMFMFPIIPYFGGFEPDSTQVRFLIGMDVEGYDPFFERPDWGYYVGCAPVDGNVEFLPLQIPDDLADPTVLEGMPAALHVEMDAEEQGTVVFDAQVVLTIPDGDWTFCQD